MGKHQTWISNSSLIQKKPWGSTKSSWVHESFKKQLGYHEKSLDIFSLLSHDKWKSVKTSKALQGKPMQEHRHCLLGSTYILSKLHISPQVSALAKHPFMLSASAKHPLIRQLLEKHHMTQLSLQRNQKCPLHSPLLAAFGTRLLQHHVYLHTPCFLLWW